MTGALICFVLPFVNIDISSSAIAPVNIIGEMLAISVTPNGTSVQGPDGGFEPLEVISIIFIVGAVISLFSTVRSYFMMRRLLNSVSPTEINGVYVRIVEGNMPSFSWGKQIVISRRDLEETTAVLTHEIMHIKCRHSMDLILYALVTTVHWFNPLVWILRTELKMLHEYEADDMTIRNGIDATQYQLLLVKKAVGAECFRLANGFNHSKLKNRITMMNKNKTNRWMRLAYFACAPVIMMTMCFCSQPKKNQKDAAEEVLSVQDTTEVLEYSSVDTKPTFNGGDASEFGKWVFSQISYPQECKEAGIEGRVIAGFTIGADGKLSDIKILRGVQEKLDAEVLRVLEMSPEWTPGIKDGKNVPVSFVFPVLFKFN